MERFFANPIYGGQDPFVCKGPDGRYYGVAESVDSRQIEVFSSDRLTDRGIRRVAYEAAESGPSSADLWAPEIWYLRGKWYIYYAGASAPGMRNWDTHRMYVLEAEDPMGPYRFAGQLELGEYMSIDGTVLELPDGRLIFIYMRKSEDMNTLFMAPMSSPTKICGEPVMLTKPEYPWESDITEGPFPIVRNGKVSVMYAANAAHLPEYCLALLHCTDPENILDPGVWVKEPQPILVGAKDIIGPGHACIVPSPDGLEDWLLFHSKFDYDNTLPGGWNRVINLLRVRWDQQERPVFAPLAARGEAIPVPAGERLPAEGGNICLRLGEAADDLAEYGYYREKTIFYEGDSLRIKGSVCPGYGDKVLVRDAVWDDFEAECVMDPFSGESGLLFRVEMPATGAYLWRGCGVYFREKHWRLVRCDGKSLTDLAAGILTDNGERRLRVRAVGKTVILWLEDTLLRRVTVPEIPSEGRIGLGTLGGDGRFIRLSVTTGSHLCDGYTE